MSSLKLRDSLAHQSRMGASKSPTILSRSHHSHCLLRHGNMTWLQVPSILANGKKNCQCQCSKTKVNLPNSIRYSV